MATQKKKSVPVEFIVGGALLLLVIGAITIYLVTRSNEDKVIEARSSDIAEEVFDENPTEKQATEVVVREEKSQAMKMDRNQVAWRVYGTVTVGETSEPVKEASLELFVDPASDYRFSQKQVQTDGAGTYEFILTDKDVPRINLAIGVRAENLAAKIQSVVPRKRRNSLPDDLELNFELVPGKTLYGRAMERDETPVPNATIGLHREVAYHGLRSENPNEVYPIAKTDDNGLFELVGVPEQQEELILIGRATGYVPGLVEVGPEEIKDITLILRPGEAIIRGTVYNEDGTPAPSTPVMASYMAKGSRPSFNFRQTVPNINIINTSTDEKGTYEFAALLSGWQGVMAGYGRPVSRSTGDMIFLEPGDDKVLNLKFLAPITINGIVVDRITQEPVAGVRLCNVRREQESPPMELMGFGGGVGLKETMTDFNGEFTMELNQTVEARFGMRPGFSYQAPPPYALPDLSWIDYNLGRNETGEEVVVRVELDKPVTIKGLVVQQDEVTPVPGAGVSFTEMNRRNFWMTSQLDAPEVYTDKQGRFELVQMPGVRGHLAATTEESFARKELNIPNDTSVVEETLVMTKYAKVSGTVTNSEDTPVSDITISASQNLGGRRSGRTTYSATTNEVGFYTLGKIAPGRLNVTANGGDDYQSPESQRVEAVSGEYLEGVDFVLPAVAEFEGYVFDEDDQPIEGVVVTQSQGGRRWGGFGGPGGGRNSSTAETDTQGYYKFENLSADQGIYRFTATHSSYEETTVDERVLSDSPLTITMTRRPRVEFVVYKNGGTQVTDFKYEINIDRSQSNRQAMNRIQRTIYAQTEPVVESLSVGDYTLHVYELGTSGDETGLYGTENIAVEGGGDMVQLEVTLGAALDVTGVVKTMDETPLEGVTVELIRLDTPRGMGRGRRGEQTQTDAKGAFSFTAVQSGSIRVEATFEGMVQVEEHDLSISPEEPPVPLEIYMSSGAVIYGTVYDVDSKPMTGAMVSVGGGSGREAQVDENGDYRIDQIEPGQYSVFLRSKSGSLLTQNSTSIDVDEEQEVNFDFVGMIDLHGGITTEPENRRPPTVTLSPAETGEAVTLSIRRNGLYEARVDPQEYNLLVSTMSGQVVADTGVSISVPSSPKRQTIDLTLRLESVGVVIGSDVELTGGTFTYVHESEQGVRTESRFKTDKTYFFIDNQPHGRCWAEYTTNDGGEFVAAEWIIINESAGKELSLIPKGLLEE